MTPLLWMGLVGGSLGAGAALATLLVIKRRLESLAMAAGIASMMVSVVSGSRLVALYERPELTLIATLIAVSSVGGGFALISSLLPYLRPKPPDPNVASPGASPGILVVILVDVESESYAPGEVTREIEELVDAGLPEPTLSVAPFHYAAQKARFRAVGDRSPEPARARELAERVESRLDPEIFSGLTLVRCADEGSLTATLRAASSAGFPRAVVVGAYVAESYRAARERGAADSLFEGTDTIAVTYTPPLWTSDDLARLISRQVLAIRLDSARTGVALVVHGQPGEHERLNESFDIQENAFANRIRMFLDEEGIDGDFVRVCTAEWREPGVTETVRHLAALGCDRVLVMPACHPFANLQTLLDMPAAARDARVPDEVRVVHLPPWGDDDTFADVLVRAIGEAVAQQTRKS